MAGSFGGGRKGKKAGVDAGETARPGASGSGAANSRSAGSRTSGSGAVGSRPDPSYLRFEVEGGSDTGPSLARYLEKALLMPEEEVCDLVDFGSIQVNGRQERNPRRALSGGEEVRVYMPWQGARRVYEIDPARIVFRDPHILAYDKEAGIPSQQTPSDAYNNVFAAVQRFLEREASSASARAGSARAPASARGANPYAALHHRLDRETSGVMLFAVDRAANRGIGDSFQHHGVLKEYLAWVEGVPALDRWTASDDIGRKNGRYTACPRGQGKPAETRFEVLARGEGKTLLRAEPLTGRTHQIRLHLSAAGHPVVGDRIYGAKPAARLYLHARSLHLPHPVTGRNLDLIAPTPPDWDPC